MFQFQVALISKATADLVMTNTIYRMICCLHYMNNACHRLRLMSCHWSLFIFEHIISTSSMFKLFISTSFMYDQINTMVHNKSKRKHILIDVFQILFLFFLQTWYNNLGKYSFNSILTLRQQSSTLQASLVSSSSASLLAVEALQAFPLYVY